MSRSEGRCFGYGPSCDTVSRPYITRCRQQYGVQTCLGVRLYPDFPYVLFDSELNPRCIVLTSLKCNDWNSNLTFLKTKRDTIWHVNITSDIGLT